MQLDGTPCLRSPAPEPEPLSKQSSSSSSVEVVNEIAAEETGALMMELVQERMAKLGLKQGQFNFYHLYLFNESMDSSVFDCNCTCSFQIYQI